MGRILHPHQTSVRNLSREPLTIMNRLPWIMHSPQTKGRQPNFPVPLHKHGGVIGIESARIANDRYFAFLVAVGRYNAGLKLGRQSFLVEESVGRPEAKKSATSFGDLCRQLGFPSAIMSSIGHES